MDIRNLDDETMLEVRNIKRNTVTAHTVAWAKAVATNPALRTRYDILRICKDQSIGVGEVVREVAVAAVAGNDFSVKEIITKVEPPLVEVPNVPEPPKERHDGLNAELVNACNDLEQLKDWCEELGIDLDKRTKSLNTIKGKIIAKL